MRHMIADPMWALPEPHLEPTGPKACGAKPRTPDRLFPEAPQHPARIGVPRRDLPGHFGARDAACDRFRRWVSDGRLRERSEASTGDPELGEIPRPLVDSTRPRSGT